MSIELLYLRDTESEEGGDDADPLDRAVLPVAAVDNVELQHDCHNLTIPAVIFITAPEDIIGMLTPLLLLLMRQVS